MKYASGKHAKGVCDICGGTEKLNTLKEVIVNYRRTGKLACKMCFDVDHPQNHVGRLKVVDAQALRNPRPDTSLLESRAMIYGWRPVVGVSVEVVAGQVTV